MSRAAVTVLALFGAAVSACLTWVHSSGELALCLGVGGCAAVQASRFAVIGPVPVATIGLAGFVAIFAIAVWRLSARAPEWTAAAVFGMALGGSAYAAYLTGIELFVIGEICPWCVTVAVSIVAILGLTVREMVTTHS